MIRQFKIFALVALCLTSLALHAIEQKQTSNHYEQALQSFNQHDYDSAYIHLKNTLKNNANHVPSKILLGRVYIEENYYPEAELELSEALALGGDLEFILTPLGKTLLAQQKFQQVISLAKKSNLSKDTKIQWYILSAQAYAGLKQPEREYNYYQQALALKPNTVDDINSLVTYYIKNKQLTKAQQLLDSSFQLNDKHPKTWHLQGLVYKEQDKVNLATNAFNKTLAIDPEYADALRSMATIYFERNDKGNALLTINQVLAIAPNDSRANLLKAHLLLQDEQTKLAREILDTLNQRLSLVSDQSLADNEWIYFIKGTSAYLLGNYEAAIREMKQYLNKNKENFQAVAIMADAYLKLDLNTAAKDLLDEYQQQVSQSVEYTALLCDLYIENNQQYRCEALLNNIATEFSESVDITLVKARLAYSRNELSAAIEITELANNKQRKQVLESYLVNLYLANNQDKKAALLIANLLLEHPNNVNLLNAMAATFIKLGKPRQAYGMTQQILAKYPQHYSARYHQALALLAAKSPSRAKSIIKALLKQQPKNAKSLLLSARIEAALGNANEAIFQLNLLLELDNYNLVASQFLVQLLRLTGQYEQALARLDQLTKRYRLDTSVIKQKAEIYILLNERKNAINKLNVLYGFWQDEANSLVTLTGLQIRAKDFTGARKSINKAKILAPKSATVKYADTKLALYEQDFSVADKQLASLNKNHKQHSQVKALAADTALAKRQLNKAQSLYLQAFTLDNTNGMALVKAYNLALKGMQKELFEQHLTQALNKQQNNFHYRNLLADFLLLNQRYAEAKLHYLRIVKVKSLPNRADVLNNLAFASMQDDLDSALKFAKQANALKGNSAPILDTLGWIMANKAQYDQALIALRQAQTINARDPAIRYHLAFTLHKLGRTKEAITELQYAANVAADFSEKSAAAELLVLLTQ